MPIEKFRPSFTFTEDRLKELQQVVPEAFADGKINWETLREALGNYLEDDEACEEHFGLFWPGKREARRLAAIPSKGTLMPAPGEGVNEDRTHNIFIEGENLEVLKLLQKSYAGRVKMIYIDPPYNTGNDFIYPDDYREPLEAYLKRTGQMDEEGRRLTTNTKASGRFHSNWLNMMYPRLLLARQLLREDGVIFVSIDDNEVHNLRQVMNEIFGQENFIEQIIWKNKYGAGAMTRGFISVHEYILCYSRQPIQNIQMPLSEEAIKKYNKKDDKFLVRGGYVTQPLATTSMDNRPNLRYPIHYQGEEIWPEKQWIWTRERTEEALKNNELVIKKKRNGKYSVRFKQYLRDKKGNLRKGKPVSILNGPFNQEGTKEIKTLFGTNIFDFPKPSALVEYLFSAVVNEIDDGKGVYMDFFAGSGPAAHAVLSLNRKDNGTRQFLLVQLPEPTPPNSAAHKAGYGTIAEIGKERIRRVIAKMQEERTGQMNLHPDEDLGFKVFRLERSHFKDWQPVEPAELTAPENLFDAFESPLVAGWQPQDLLVEILLQEGFPLDSQVIPLTDGFPANHVYRIHAEGVAHDLFICLDDEIQADTVTRLKNGLLRQGDSFICLDTALTDQAKVVLSDRLQLKVI